MSSDHDTPIKTPKQLITVVLLALIVPIIIIVLLVSYVNSQKRTGGSGSKSDSSESVAQRIKPIAGFELRDATTPRILRTGEEVYKAQCTACHAAGAAGAPKFGDASLWSARIKTGYEALLNSSLKGKGAMSAQSGGEYSDEEIGRAVVYMANAAGAKFADVVPKAAAAAPAAAEAPAAPATSAVIAPLTTAPVATAVATAAPAVIAADSGKALYEKACVACHAAGVAGSPKFGDKAAWASRASAGVTALTASVIKGKGAMPAKGGSNGSDAEIKAAVEYMLAAVK